MKKTNIKYLLTIVVAIFAFSSCSEDFLKEEPTTGLPPEALLQDRDGAEIYVLGAYDAIQHSVTSGGQGFDGWAVHWGTIATDEVVVPGWAGDRKLMFLQQMGPLNGTLYNIWTDLYKGVNIANSVVDRISATEGILSAEDKAQFVAEGKFVRAVLYFSLVTTWENIPLRTSETTDLDDLDKAPASPQEVYDFIIEDLKFASANLPAEQGEGRATQGAAQALLGKVYLQMTGFPLNQIDKFALAEAELQKVINSGVYGLLESYPDIFDLTDEQHKEMVFSLGMDGPSFEEGGNLSTFYGPNGNVNNGGGWGTCYINQEFEATYDRDDIRLLNNVAKHNANEWTPEEGMYNPDSWSGNKIPWRGWKWHAEKPNGYANDTPFDNPYIRYSDVLLMFAEARNGQNKLTQGDIDLTINKIRARARIENPDRPAGEIIPDMFLGSQSANADEILSERRKELCLEGWRRNDLIRFGKYKEVILAIDQVGWSTSGNPGPNYSDHEIRWPIPNQELQLNKLMKQNDGY